MRDYSYSELDNGIDEWIVGRNAERNRLILKKKLIDGWSYQQILDYLNQEGMPANYRIELRQLQRIICNGRTVLFRHI